MVKKLQLYLSPEEYKRLTAAADGTKRSTSEFVRWLFSEHEKGPSPAQKFQEELRESLKNLVQMGLIHPSQAEEELSYLADPTYLKRIYLASLVGLPSEAQTSGGEFKPGRVGDKVPKTPHLGKRARVRRASEIRVDFDTTAAKEGAA